MDRKENLTNLNKYLAAAGLGSRRHCDQLIQKAQVIVNGKVAELGMKVNPDKDHISVKGQGEITALRAEPRYIVLYKPCGYLTTMHDPYDRPTIKEFFPDLLERIFPVGRLDYTTEGLLLLTNDGDLAFRLTHPKFMIEKTYQVKVKGAPSPDSLLTIRKGIKLEDGWTSVDSIKAMKIKTQANKWFLVKVHEGRKRLIRRVFDSIGHPVLKLKRISFAGITLGRLEPGEWRDLTKEEVMSLKNL